MAFLILKDRGILLSLSGAFYVIFATPFDVGHKLERERYLDQCLSSYLAEF